MKLKDFNKRHPMTKIKNGSENLLKRLSGILVNRSDNLEVILPMLFCC